jgi:streptomycin 6-kinase
MRDLSFGAHGRLTRAEQDRGMVASSVVAASPVDAAPSADRVRDPLIPEVDVLLGPDGASVVAAAIAATGGVLIGAERVQVSYEPGNTVAVRWEATTRWPDGRTTVESIVASATPDGPPAGSFPLEADGLRIGLHRWPFDPELPGLELATDSALRPEWWSKCGDVHALDVVTYRPGRRAVIRGVGDAGEVYVKVLKPRRAERVLRRFATFSRAGVPVPEVLHADADVGVVVTAALPGCTLRDLLNNGDDVPDPTALLGLLDRLPAELATDARRIALPSAELDRHSSSLAAVLPESMDVLRRIRDAVEAGSTADDVPAHPVPVHGDFHDDQLLVTDGAITGLLDIDGAGAGSRADDLGTMLGHLVNRESDVGTAAYSAYVARTHEAFAAAVGERVLARQVAAVLVGLATGPYRVQEERWRERTLDRLAVAEQWAASA